MYTKITQAMFAGKNSAQAEAERDLVKNEKSRKSTDGIARLSRWIAAGRPNTGSQPRRAR